MVFLTGPTSISYKLYFSFSAWFAPFLNWRPWALLGRITYTAYLSQGAVLLYTAGIVRSPVYTGMFNLVSKKLILNSNYVNASYYIPVHIILWRQTKNRSSEIGNATTL